MADKRISQLDSTVLLTGAELVALVQPIIDPKDNKKVTLSDIMQLAPVQSVNGLTGTVLITAGDLGALVAGSNISLLTNDAGYLTGSGTINEITYWASPTTLGNLAVATYPSLTELSYVKGATGTIQTQLGTKWSLAEGGVLTGANVFAATGTNNLTFNYATLGANTGFLISSTSTDAASNTQTLFKSTQSGANVTASQTTYAGYFSNTKGGTLPLNIAGYFEASGGDTNLAIKTVGNVLFADNISGVITPSTRLDVRGTGTGTENIIRLANSNNILRLTTTNEGVLNLTSIARGGSISVTHTATASLQSSFNFTGTATNIATGTSTLYGYVFDPTLNANGAGGNIHTQVAVYINPTFGAVGSASTVNHEVLRLSVANTQIHSFSKVGTNGVSFVMGSTAPITITRVDATASSLSLSHAGGDLGSGFSANNFVTTTINRTGGATTLSGYSFSTTTLGTMTAVAVNYNHINLGASTVNAVSTGQMTWVNSNPTFTDWDGAVTGYDWNPTTPANIAGTHLAFRSTSGSIQFQQGGLTTNWIPAIKSTAGAHTGLTAATEFISNDFVGATQTWVDGTVATQRFNYFRGYTANKTTTSAIFTDIYNVYIDTSTAGAGVTFTNNWALGVNGKSLFVEDIQIGTSSVAGHKIISAINSTADANISLKSQGIVYLLPGVDYAIRAQDTNGYIGLDPNGGLIFYTKLTSDANSAFEILAGGGISGSIHGQGMWLETGYGAVGQNGNSGSLYFLIGEKDGSGTYGNVSFFELANFQSMQKGLFIGNAVAEPTGNPANGVFLWGFDVSSSSELKVRDEAGNTTTLSPHNFSLIGKMSEDMAWSYYSEKKMGDKKKRINVDMLAVIREVEKIVGRQLVFEDEI